MKTSISIFLFFLLCLVGLPGSSHEVISEIDDRTDLRVVIYQGAPAFLVDTREFQLPEPEGVVFFHGIPSRLKPDTLDIYPESPLHIITRYYQEDLIQMNRLLELYVGSEVKVTAENVFAGWEPPFSAELLGVDQGKAMLQKDSDVFFVSPKKIMLPDYDQKLSLFPYISWHYKTEEPYEGVIEVSKMVEGLDWKADYILTLAQEEKKADLTGWLTIQNRGNHEYPEARVQVIAGTVQQEKTVPTRHLMAEEAAAMGDRGIIQEEAMYEYYSYSIPEKINIQPRQNVQVSFHKAEEVPFEKEYLVINRQPRHFRSQHPEDEEVPVQVFISVENKEENQLGRPFPAGSMRVFQKNEDQERVFVGGESISRVPEGETLRVKTGQSFDLVARRRQKELNRLSQNVYESEWQVSLRNSKEEDVKIGVIEELSGTWTILQSSHEYEKLDASRVRYEVPVPAGEKVELTYKVRTDFSR